MRRSLCDGATSGLTAGSSLMMRSASLTEDLRVAALMNVSSGALCGLLIVIGYGTVHANTRDGQKWLALLTSGRLSRAGQSFPE